MKSQLISLWLFPGIILTSASAQVRTPAEQTVRTASGIVRGVIEGDVSRFKGIPYAAAPAPTFARMAGKLDHARLELGRARSDTAGRMAPALDWSPATRLCGRPHRAGLHRCGRHLGRAELDGAVPGEYPQGAHPASVFALRLTGTGS